MGEQYTSRYLKGKSFRCYWNHFCNNSSVDYVVNMVSEYFPTRAQVNWIIGDDGFVVIIVEKELSEIERKLAKIFEAPPDVRRPLDDMNSELWLLMDGKNTLADIILRMDKLFDERIAPVSERVSKSISEFLELGLAVIVRDPMSIDWSIDPRED